MFLYIVFLIKKRHLKRLNGVLGESGNQTEKPGTQTWLDIKTLEKQGFPVESHGCLDLDNNTLWVFTVIWLHAMDDCWWIEEVSRYVCPVFPSNWSMFLLAY